MTDDSIMPRATSVKVAGAASNKSSSEQLIERFWSLWKGPQAGEPGEETAAQASGAHQTRLLSNVKTFHELTVDDVMVPRAEIAAVEISTGLEPLLDIVCANSHSRFPVYRETLDEVVGVFHIKDLLVEMRDGDSFDLSRIVRPVPIIAPSMRALDLLLAMRRDRNHIALVVDEFGGIDGLVTIEDLIEEIVGEIEDEHDRDSYAETLADQDGSLLVDARMPIDEFEREFGTVLGEDERDNFDTVGGLIWTLAGHIPSPGEIVQHDSGAEFEIIDADQRRIKRVRARRTELQPRSLGEISA